MDLKVVWRFMRPATLPAPAAGVIGGAIAAGGGWPGDPLPLVLAVASALLLTGASNGLNQIADIDTDRINRPERPLPAGHLGIRQAWWIVAALLAPAVALAAAVDTYYLACVLVTVPVTAAYSFPPVRTKRIPYLSNATIATPRGLLLVLAGWAVGGGFWRAEAWLLGALAWLYLFGAATTKDFGDIEGDRATGCVTLPLRLGPKGAARFVAPFLVVPFLLYPAAAAAGQLPGGVAAWGLLGGCLAVLGAVAAALLLKNPRPPASGRPHPAWGLMYLQLTAAHLGAAAIFAM
ncbi:MAG: UbiA family prenyltransferase [Deltaproteobacteria bacterium]|nr:UbiA family prenyltransferase [Deltaproteobacteria bacterium]